MRHNAPLRRSIFFARKHPAVIIVRMSIPTPPVYDESAAPNPEAEMVGKLAQLPLSHQPGTTFEYGMSTDVLGHIVEVVSGTGLDCFFAEHQPAAEGGLAPAVALRFCSAGSSQWSPAIGATYDFSITYHVNIINRMKSPDATQKPNSSENRIAGGRDLSSRHES